MMNRRLFLKSSGLALAGTALMPGVFVRMARAGTTRGRKTLVAVFQRGAVDGLNVVVPYGDEAYYAARRSIAIARPKQENGALELDGFFGAHPSLAALMPYFADRSLAFVHAVGSPDSTRSHFDAQDFMECGTPGIKSTQDGFLSRAVIARKDASSTSLRAVAFSPNLPRILSGSADAVAMTDVARFGVRGGAADSFEAMYGGEAFEAVKLLRATSPEKLQPANGAQYPRTPLGNSLQQIAQLIKAGVGLEIAFADVGGWDTHAAQGGAQGQLANNLRQFAEGIAAFAKDLGSRMSDVILVTMSEFGRTVRENGNRGTDHGHATVMLALGGGIKGGKVHGKWPGLGMPALHEGRDLAVTTDFRDVFGELLTEHLGVPSLKTVFPRYEGKSLSLLG
jgi:uncharacterized protein (DUF1501 family)